MSLPRSITLLAALLALGATSAAAQSRRPAPIWSIPFPDRDVRWESRDGDSDSDSDSDRDSDSDARSRRGSIFDRVDRRDRSDSDARSRRGSIFDRVDRRDRSSNRRVPDRRDRGVVLEREVERAHDEWHRRNDRYRGERDWERRHVEMHDALDRARRQSGRAGRGGVIR